MVKRSPRPGGTRIWYSWADLPPEVKSAVVWAFWAGGPADDEDWGRLSAALNVGTPLHEAAFLEEARWMVRGLNALNEAGGFQGKYPKERLFEAVSMWLGKSVSSVKRDAGGYSMRGKPLSSRWAVEDAQSWFKQHRNDPQMKSAAPDFSDVLRLLEPTCFNGDFHSWEWAFEDGYGRQIKPHWSLRVVRKALFERQSGVHWGYVVRELPSNEGPGGLIFLFPRSDPSPLGSLNDLDFSFWVTRWAALSGASAMHLSPPLVPG